MRHRFRPRNRSRRTATLTASGSRRPVPALRLQLPAGSGRRPSYLCASRVALARMQAQLAAFWRPAVAWWMAPC